MKFLFGNAQILRSEAVSIFSFLITTLVLTNTGFAATPTGDARYYEITSVTVKEVADTARARNIYMREAMETFSNGCQTTVSPSESSQQTPFNPVDSFEVVVDKVINIGKKIWAIVEAGKPVVNLTIDKAHALPSGIGCWTDLEGWKSPKTKVYQVTYKNGYGVSVIDFSFRVSFIYGGSYNGKGQYITMATIQPANISVSWGYNFDAVATVPAVFNQGTKTSPVGAMQLVMNWRVQSPLKSMQHGETFFINGQGTLEHLKD